jgi:hypothetical protein
MGQSESLKDKEDQQIMIPWLCYLSDSSLIGSPYFKRGIR